MTPFLLCLFWCAAGLVLYVVAGFPLLVLVRAALWRRPCQAADITPTVSLIIAAHNEAAQIGQRIENALAQDYPRDKLEVLVASDGSTDNTNGIVAGYAGRGVRLLALPRGGKIPTLNAAAAAARGEVLAFSDANTSFAPDALRKLVRPLADPAVGGVAGNQVYLEGGKDLAADGERAYWNFDRWLKQAESRAGHVVSATGAIYALRRSLFRPIPPGVTDDFVASTAVIAQGYRLVFAADALAYEPVAQGGAAEFGRKVRVMTQGFRSLAVMRELLNPCKHGFYALQLLSHKVLRRLLVFPLLLLAVSAPLLWSEGLVYRLAALAFAAFLALALAGLALRHTWLGRWKGFTVPCYLLLVNAAAFSAAVNAARGRRVELWKPSRPQEAAAGAAAGAARSARRER